MTFAVAANEKGEKVLTMPKEYIEREKLLQDIEHYHLSDGKFQHWVEIQPAADVAEVVRCRECLCYTPVDDNIGKCVFLTGKHQYVVPDGYCYLGELKKGVD